MENQFDGISRRSFIYKMMALGGASAAFVGLNAFTARQAQSADLPPQLVSNGTGKKVVILGAGIAGMTSAYELAKKGYQVQIIEARDFAGGRCQTARHGKVIEELGHEKQTCDFDEGQYLNMGPMRIPAHHKSTLYYTKEFNIPLETYINYNEDAWVYDDHQKGIFDKPVRMREILADMRGYTSEMMAKSVGSETFDMPMTDEDKVLMLDYLVKEGHLDSKDLKYKGYSGRGYVQDPAALMNPGKESQAYKLDQLLKSNLWKVASSVSSHSQPKTTFQPVGGMDKIAKGFEAQTKQFISYQTEVSKIRQSNGKVFVETKSLKDDSTQTIEADFCICTLPLSVLKQIDTDFSEAYKQAMSAVAYTPACKLGIQTKTRFWETNDGIYGGHSLITAGNPKTGNITYPSHDMFTDKGVLLAAYNYNADAAQFSALKADERFKKAIESGSLVHGDDYATNAEKHVSVSWHLMKYNLGGWASWTQQARDKYYPTLCEPEGNIFLAGEHMSYMTGWMAGAIESAWEQLAKLDAMASQTAKVA